MVLNKLDLTGLAPAVERDEYDRIRRVRVSAMSSAGLPLLREALAEMALEKMRTLRNMHQMNEVTLSVDTALNSGSSL
jgi:GTP-binding protein HflX